LSFGSESWGKAELFCTITTSFSDRSTGTGPHRRFLADSAGLMFNQSNDRDIRNIPHKPFVLLNLSSFT
jgi:hypothetical protein